MVKILFPGRHHLLTKFQYTYLRSLIDQGVNGKKIDVDGSGKGEYP